MKKALLLDVSAIMYRAFYAHMNFRSKGKPTGAIFGFVNTLLGALEEFQPDYVLGGFDVKRSSLKRSEAYKEYKADRKPMPEDLAMQIEGIEEVLDAFGIERVKIEGHEADDVLGSLGKRLSKEGVEVYILTGDKDLSQVLDENINIALLGKGEKGERFKILREPEDVVEQLGVLPNEIPDLFGLIGDSSDGIPGVRKVGPKKAIPMLEKYKNLEGIYENVDKLVDLPGIGKGLIKNIEEDRELAFLSRELATIEVDLEIDRETKTFEYKKDREKLLEIFKRYDFKSLIKKLSLGGAKEVEVAPKKEKSSTNTQLGLFDLGGQPSNLKEVRRHLKVVENGLEIDSLAKEIEELKKVAILINEVGLGVSTEKNDYYIPLGHNLGKNIGKILVERLFTLKGVKYYTYKYKEFLKRYKRIEGEVIDLQLLHYLLTSSTREDIDKMILSETYEALDEYKDIFGKKSPNELSEIALGEFTCKRSKILLEIGEDLEKRIKEDKLEKVYKEIEVPLVEILDNMEKRGIKLDVEKLSRYQEELKERIDELTKNIYDQAGEEFNLNSSKQLGSILFEKLEIPPVKKTKTGYSTNVEVLEVLENMGYPVARDILLYRQLTKLQSTYVEALPKLVDKKDRIHTTFNQTGTATGRLSSSDPNLQNIPARTEEGLKIRESFVAEDEYTLLAIDYSQIELRVLAYLSEDENLIKAYEDDLDLHSRTAMKIFDLESLEDVTRDKRDIGKIINFSIIYGKTPFGLAKELGITQKDAKRYIERYFEEYPQVRELEEKIIREATEDGFVRTDYGRKREIDGLQSKNINIQKQGARMAVNTVIQGTAADILKIIMIQVDKELKDDKDIKMLLQVHDELVFEVKEEVAEKYAQKIQEIMENHIKLKGVKLKANYKIGKNWAETK